MRYTSIEQQKKYGYVPFLITLRKIASIASIAICGCSAISHPKRLRDYDGIGIMMSHARGAKLFTEGDPARNVFVICFGQVKISSTSRDGKTMILKIAGPGDVMGLSAVLANVPHEVTAEAIEPCQVKTVRQAGVCRFSGPPRNRLMHAAQSLSGEYLTVFHDAKRLALSGSAAGGWHGCCWTGAGRRLTASRRSGSRWR
jgi:hypothetical protein